MVLGICVDRSWRGCQGQYEDERGGKGCDKATLVVTHGAFLGCQAHEPGGSRCLRLVVPMWTRRHLFVISGAWSVLLAKG